MPLDPNSAKKGGKKSKSMNFKNYRFFYLKIFQFGMKKYKYDFSFANGGDQNNNIIPERPICDQMGINLVNGLGDKIQSSSWLLKK